jgi:hypothetical protein
MLHHGKIKSLMLADTCPALVKNLVGFAEFFILQFFIGKGFHYPDTLQGIFQVGVEGSYLFPIFPVSAPEPALKKDGIENHEGQKREYHQGKPAVNAEQDNKSADKTGQGNEEIFRPVMTEFRHIEEIAGDPGHEGPCSLLVKETQRKPLAMVEQFVPHVPFYHRAHCVSPEIIKNAGDSPNDDKNYHDQNGS